MKAIADVAPIGDLFALAPQLAQDATSPAWLPSRADRARIRQRDYERLEPVVLELAVRVGANGFTADDLREAAIDAQILTGDEGIATGQTRALSWLGPFLATLARRGLIVALTYADGAKVKRNSKRDRANGNPHVVYVAAKYARKVA